MTSNEHGAIEQNIEHHEANNLTYYTHETEVYAESYAMMNRCTCCRILRLRNISGTGKVNARDGSRSDRGARAPMALTGDGRGEGGGAELGEGEADEGAAGARPGRGSGGGGFEMEMPAWRGVLGLRLACWQ